MFHTRLVAITNPFPRVLVVHDRQCHPNVIGVYGARVCVCVSVCVCVCMATVQTRATGLCCCTLGVAFVREEAIRKCVAAASCYVGALFVTHMSLVREAWNA